MSAFQNKTVDLEAQNALIIAQEKDKRPYWFYDGGSLCPWPSLVDDTEDGYIYELPGLEGVLFEYQGPDPDRVPLRPPRDLLPGVSRVLRRVALLAFLFFTTLIWWTVVG